MLPMASRRRLHRAAVVVRINKRRRHLTAGQTGQKSASLKWSGGGSRFGSLRFDAMLAGMIRILSRGRGDVRVSPVHLVGIRGKASRSVQGQHSAARTGCILFRSAIPTSSTTTPCRQPSPSTTAAEQATGARPAATPVGVLSAGGDQPLPDRCSALCQELLRWRQARGR